MKNGRKIVRSFFLLQTQRVILSTARTMNFHNKKPQSKTNNTGRLTTKNLVNQIT